MASSPALSWNDGFLRGGALNTILWEFGIAAGGIFVLTYLQSIVQTYASEQVARDLRNNLSEKISTHSFGEVQKITPSDCNKFNF